MVGLSGSTLPSKRKKDHATINKICKRK